MPELTFWTDLFPVAPVLYHLLNQGLQAASEAKNAMSWIFLPAPPYKALVMIYFFPLTFFGFVLGPLIRQYLPNSGSSSIKKAYKSAVYNNNYFSPVACNSITPCNYGPSCKGFWMGFFNLWLAGNNFVPLCSRHNMRNWNSYFIWELTNLPSAPAQGSYMIIVVNYHVKIRPFFTQPSRLAKTRTF